MTTMPACTVAPRSLTNRPRNSFILLLSTAITASMFRLRLIRGYSRLDVPFVAQIPDAREMELLALAGVVLRIDVIKKDWRLSVNLHNHLARSHYVVMHVWIKVCEAAGGECRHFVRVEGVSHSNLESPGDHSHVLSLRVPM